ncbi:MAG: hypothetical protein PHV59_09825 [Victivallales bacterium]|nr:hypothetical protein [Victivallales bacterium]
METHQQEIEALRAELEDYRKEKEQIRQIIGAIGGAAVKTPEKVLNFIFVFLLCLIFVADILRHFGEIKIPYVTSLLSIEIGVLLVSVKIIWMIHKQSKVEHFQFWILNSIEFRLNSIAKKLNQLDNNSDKN